MKKKSIFLLAVSFLLLFNLSFAQQDPFDPNEADTLYFTAGGYHSDDGDTLYLPPGGGGGDVVILINFWNDNNIKGFTVPLTDSCYGAPGNAYLDPAKNSALTEDEYPVCFEGSRVAGYGFGIVNLLQNPPDVLYGMVCTTLVGPGDGLFASMVYTLADTTTFCLDTIFFPPENALKFVLTDGIHGYRPIFLPDTFHVGWRPNKAPLVDAPESDSAVLKDSIDIVFTAEDPDFDSLLHDPAIQIIPDCGSYSVVRTDTGEFTGTWELTFRATTGCSLRTYDIVMEVEDFYGAVGSDTTEITVWKPNRSPQIVAPDTIFGYTDTMPGYEDTVIFTFSAFDPDSDEIFLWDKGFWEPSCAKAESLKRTFGQGTYQGVWEVMIRTVNCDTGDYLLQMAVEDERSEGPQEDGWTADTTVLHLDVKPHSPPILDAPETLSVWIDYELDFTFYAADPDSHKLRDSSSISVEPYCGDTCEYWVERLWGLGDPGHPSGEWQVQFNAYKSDSDYYHIILDVEDDHDSTGYDTVVVHVYPRPNYNPNVFAPPTASAHVNDTIKYVFTASDPDSNKLLDIASVTVEPDCGTAFSLRQTGAHHFSGTWILTFYTVGCTVGVYDIIVDVKDVRDGVGYDTTTILVTDRPNRAPVVVAPYLVSGKAGEILKFNFSAVDPDTDDIVDAATIMVLPDCGIYFANRTIGIGTYTGIWEVTFKTTGCSPGTYDLSMEVQDVYGKIGYDLSQVQLSPTDVEEEQDPNLSIDRFALNQNYPNPFNLSTEIKFQLPVKSRVSLKIYNTKGQLVRSLIDGNRDRGIYSINWDGTDEAGMEVASGVYFYKLTAGDFTSIKKMALVK